MTVGIGAICEGGKAIVMAADRQVSFDNGLIHESVHPKLVRISPHAAIAITGGYTESDLAAEKLSSAISLPDLTTVAQIAVGLQRCCYEIRAEVISATLTKRQLGISFEEFSKQMLSLPGNQAIGEVFGNIKAFNLNLGILLAGIDTAGAHLYGVSDTLMTAHRNPGCTAIGSGQATALTAMLRCAHQSTKTLAETAYWVYAAKRAAESVAGVGPTTDILILRAGEPSEFLRPASIAKLQEMYERISRPILSECDLATLSGILPPTPTPPDPKTSEPPTTDPPDEPEQA